MTTVLRPLLWPRSLGGGILFTLFGIFKFCIAVRFLAPMMFLGVWALPTSPSTSVPLFSRVVTNTTSSPTPQTSQSSSSTQSFSTAHPSANAGKTSGTSQLTDGQLTILLGVIGSVIIAITILLFLKKWRRKKQHHGSSAKDEDRQPLSASFQPGELPTLPYWPQPKSPPPQGLA